MSVLICSISSMMRIRIGLAMLGFSVFAILLLRMVRVPFMDPDGYASGILAFVVLGLVFLYFIKIFKLPSLSYFALPRITPVSIFALIMAVLLSFSAIAHEENEMKPWTVAVPGILFLLSIGFGEEIVSRGFLYGVLKKRSHKSAIFISSLFFGLMHLNLYIGSNWDPWAAYWHVSSAFCFGIFICAVVVATQSIWVGILVHAIFDWSIVFEKVSKTPPRTEPISIAFWDGIISPSAEIMFLFIPGMAILFFCRKRRIWAPRWIKKVLNSLAVRWKLVEEEGDKFTLVGQN